jgi:hypothetical protein
MKAQKAESEWRRKTLNLFNQKRQSTIQKGNHFDLDELQIRYQNL